MNTHRVVAESKLGRTLQDGEIVHHHDGNRLNCAADNLDILPSQGVHARLHFAKLTAEQVREIRSLAAGGARNVDLAMRFNIGAGAIHSVICRKTWKDV